MPEPETEVFEASPEQVGQMQVAEDNVEKRQYVEWHDKLERTPSSQIELDNLLLTVEARLANKRQLLKNAVKMPDGTFKDKVVELETDWPEIFTGDMAKANYSEHDIQSVWGNGVAVNYLYSVGTSRGLDFRPAASFFKANIDLFTNVSRGRGMATAILTKTDKHVSEGVVQHVQQMLAEKKQKRWGFL